MNKPKILVQAVEMVDSEERLIHAADILNSVAQTLELCANDGDHLTNESLQGLAEQIKYAVGLIENPDFTKSVDAQYNP